MTTNKEAIRVLCTPDFEAHIDTDLRRSAVDAAIRALEFADACSPKDEAAERIYCAQSITEPLLHGSDEHRAWLMIELVPLLERVRAQARGEAKAKYAAMLAPKDDAEEREHCFGVAQELLNAHIQPLEDRIERERAQARGEGRALEKLKAAQAEIVQLKLERSAYRREAGDAGKDIADYKAKLTNLRAAAERSCRWLEVLSREEGTRDDYASATRKNAETLRGAIKASK